MNQVLHISPSDPTLETINFRPYRNILVRQAQQFLPGPGEPQTMQVQTPWGETLHCNAGDYLVNEMDAPQDRWVVERHIFEETYVLISPGCYVKNPLTHLASMLELTGNDPDCTVVVHTLEGPVTVRAGDFYLARGIKGEIWPYPKEKADKALVLAEE